MSHRLSRLIASVVGVVLVLVAARVVAERSQEGFSSVWTTDSTRPAATTTPTGGMAAPTTAAVPPFAPANGQFGAMPLVDKATIKEGDSGASVAYLQGVLRVKGKQVDVKVDGLFGPKTRAAVLNLQGLFSLPQTGVVDPATWKAVDFLAGSAS